jgi:hypothetical protein
LEAGPEDLVLSLDFLFLGFLGGFIASRCKVEPEPPADTVCGGQLQSSDPSGDGIPVDARMGD